ncbi:hypothetical protein LRH25_21925 [Ideonella azotifigens]|uniref:DUF423 domain-containing protein n=1 Tax=Ideonella azotifigens TaxID=513160 RepID=A0ABN1KBR8_9BURK|nr:hypothetical protein [Ideonella azotifigens]MCD2342991.1 hypothetical protein [Ideonella azotifigens]
MKRSLAALGLVGAVLLLADSAAHSLLGWPAMQAKLQAANAPADLQQGLAMGWHFGGLAMLVFGLLCLQTAWAGWRGRHASALLMGVVGLAMTGFGVGSAVLTGWDPFLLVFLLPGVLLLISATGAPKRD